MSTREKFSFIDEEHGEQNLLNDSTHLFMQIWWWRISFQKFHLLVDSSVKPFAMFCIKLSVLN